MNTRSKKRKLIKNTVIDSDSEEENKNDKNDKNDTPKKTIETQTDEPDEEYDEDEEYEDNEEEDEEYDDDFEEDEEYDDLIDEEYQALHILKKTNPEHYQRFIAAKEVMKGREITIFDILAIDISDEKRATLLEKFECLKNIEPYTEDYLEHRDRLRNLYYKYIAEIPPIHGWPEFKTTSMHSIPNINLNPRTSPSYVSIGVKKMTDAEAEISGMKEKIKNLECSSSNRKVFEEKVEEFEDNMKGDEKSKIKRWLNMAITLPLDRLSKQAKEVSIVNTIQETQTFLDKRLYGMKNVKERLLLFLNKKLREGNSRGCNIALVGKPGVGKCLHPETEIRMYDLSVKKAKDIVEGDLLLGDDQTPRTVLSITSGTEEMFSVQQQYGETYIVNRSHILTLREKDTGKVVDIPIVDVINNQDKYTPYSAAYFGEVSSFPYPFDLGKFYSSPVNVSSDIDKEYYCFLPADYMKWTKEDKSMFFQGIVSGSEIVTNGGDDILIHIAKSRPIHSIMNLIRSMGWRCTYDSQNYLLHVYLPGSKRTENITIRSIGEGSYCGFTLNDNERFVLMDWTVTHNTAISKALSECLQLPFAQVSFGGITNAEFLMGHDYTYIGSRPGEITRCLIRMGSKNGILFFDEFDKATDKKDIMSTLLHITDFSQNSEFRDNYFPELTQDLSKIWFIYSMNELPTDPAMLDRLEVIRVDEYTSEERSLIAKNYLFPKYNSELKIGNDIVITDSGLKEIIDVSSGHQNKKGVRDLERCINLVVEKVYFFLCNREANYEYGWYKKIKECLNEQKQVLITKALVEHILEGTKKDSDSHLSMYL
jgi:hypothetical protein